MTLKFHSTVLFVKDIELSKNFYCSILNQEIDTDFGNNITLKGDYHYGKSLIGTR